MKILNYRVLVSLSVILASIFIYSTYIQKEKNKIATNLETEEKNFTNSNIIKDIKYSSNDIEGNEYTIFADEGEIDLQNSEIIFLKKVKTFINLIEKNEVITITADFGKYNTVNYDTIFSKNIEIQYQDNIITGNYLDFSMKKNLLIISKNVVYTDPENVLKADVIKLNTITKDIKIFMHNSKDKIDIESKN